MVLGFRVCAPQSRTAKRSRAILKQQRRLESKTKESTDAVSSLLTEQEGCAK